MSKTFCPHGNQNPAPKQTGPWTGPPRGPEDDLDRPLPLTKPRRSVVEE
jgi:hypothetical protein